MGEAVAKSAARSAKARRASSRSARRNSTPPITAETILEETRKLNVGLGISVQQLVDGVRKETDTATAQAREEISLATIVMLALGVGTLIGSVLFVWLYVGRSILRRIRSLQRSMQLLSGGDLESEIYRSSQSDEIAAMAECAAVFRESMIEARALRPTRTRTAPPRPSALPAWKPASPSSRPPFAARSDSLQGAANSMQSTAQSMSTPPTSPARWYGGLRPRLGQRADGLADCRHRSRVVAWSGHRRRPSLQTVNGCHKAASRRGRRPATPRRQSAGASPPDRQSHRRDPQPDRQHAVGDDFGGRRHPHIGHIGEINDVTTRSPRRSRNRARRPARSPATSSMPPAAPARFPATSSASARLRRSRHGGRRGAQRLRRAAPRSRRAAGGDRRLPVEYPRGVSETPSFRGDAQHRTRNLAPILFPDFEIRVRLGSLSSGALRATRGAAPE